MAWEENSCISLNMQLIAILSRIGVYDIKKQGIYIGIGQISHLFSYPNQSITVEGFQA